MLDVEFIEELLAITLEGVQDKKDYLDKVCEKYIILDNKEDIEQKFLGVIEDISQIFDLEKFPICDIRFLLSVCMCFAVERRKRTAD